MMWKQVITLVVIFIGVSVADRLTLGTRQNGDRYLFTETRSTLPTTNGGKHELLLEEEAVRATYFEFNVFPDPQEIVIKKFNEKAIKISCTHANATQLVGELRVFGFPN